MRLPETDIAIIDRAADLRGPSRTDFVREAAVRTAEEIVMESALIRMSPKGFNPFMSAIEAPAAAVPGLVILLKPRGIQTTDGLGVYRVFSFPPGNLAPRRSVRKCV
jgi:uncharacterized protein (DUF1778 family)